MFGPSACVFNDTGMRLKSVLNSVYFSLSVLYSKTQLSIVSLHSMG